MHGLKLQHYLPVSIVFLFSVIACSMSPTVSRFDPVTASSTAPPAAVRAPTATTFDLGMYAAALDAFFDQKGMRDMATGPVPRHKVVYIQPTFQGGAGDGTALPGALIQMITRQVRAIGLRTVSQMDQDGLALMISGPGRDAARTRAAGMDVPTIWIYLSTRGVGYVLTRTAAGWTAQEYEDVIQ